MYKVEVGLYGQALISFADRVRIKLVPSIKLQRQHNIEIQALSKL